METLALLGTPLTEHTVVLTYNNKLNIAELTLHWMYWLKCHQNSGGGGGGGVHGVSANVTLLVILTLPFPAATCEGLKLVRSLCGV